MKAFRVKGEFLMGDRWQEFTKEVVGRDENAVCEEIYSRLGSKHRVKRGKIQISEVMEIPSKEVSDPITKYHLEKASTKKKIVRKKRTEKGEKNG
ncbi:MAG: 50S ribosomal protein LX [Methanomassiliicoccales archaeon]|nr:MAG: 50S ribosomal protein LX [Methanomassiliicoccales archaeon]